jgi:hypothetical protein
MFNITLPAFVFGLLLGGLYGAVFHLWKGGGLFRLLLYLVLGCFGFWIGHFAGQIISWSFLSIGPINFGIATLGSIVFLVGGYWLSLINDE